MGHMEAQGLYQSLLLHGGGLVPVDVVVRLKQKALRRQSGQLVPGLRQEFRLVLGQGGTELRRTAVFPVGHGSPPLHESPEQIERYAVQHVDRAAVYVYGDFYAEGFKGMYGCHCTSSSQS